MNSPSGQQRVQALISAGACASHRGRLDRVFDGPSGRVTEVCGPNLALLGFDAAVTVDRFGYVYLTAIPETGAGTDWWARKLNPSRAL
jgi:hypothetical protein